MSQLICKKQRMVDVQGKLYLNFFSPYLLQIILIPKFMEEDLLNSLLEEARNVKDKFQIIQWQTATRPTYKGGILSSSSSSSTTTTTKKK